jgi:hypothetical protein
LAAEKTDDKEDPEIKDEDDEVNEENEGILKPVLVFLSLLLSIVPRLRAARS